MDKLRTVTLRPYGYRGPRFTLSTWDAGEYNGRTTLRCRLTMRDESKTSPTRIFEAADFGCSPMHAIDSDETLRSLFAFLTLRIGDTDREYFDSYNAEQVLFREHHAEALSIAALERFGE